MSYDEERIVSLRFDNASFKKDVEESIKSLKKLEKELEFDDINETEVFDDLIDETKKVEYQLGSMSRSVDSVKASFSALQVVGITVLSELTKAAISAGKRIYDATMGQILAGGSARALNIEAAKFQLAGLDVEWADIKQNIEYGVQDTAYGLDSAAKVASQLVASGIQYGRTIENGVEQLSMMDVALRGISGVAAMTNSSYDDIGHLFTTVAGNGRLMGDNLLSLSTRGLNAAQTLAEYLGKTEQEIRDMVSKGQISFETFANAMDSAFGEHAKDANNTFTGAMSNIKAALSRVGEKFLTPWYDYAKKILNIIRPVINYMNNALTPAMLTFKNMLFFSERFINNLFSVRDFQVGLVGLVVDLWSYVRVILVALGEMTGKQIDFESFGESFKNLVNSFQLYGDRARDVKDILKALFSIIEIGFTLIKGLGIALSPILNGLVSILGSIFEVTGSTSQIIFQLSKPIERVILLVAEFIKLGIQNSLWIIPAAIRVIIDVLSKLIKVLAIGIGFIFEIGYVIGSLIKRFVLLVANIISGNAAIKYSFTDLYNVLLNGFELINGFIRGNGLLINSFDNLFTYVKTGFIAVAGVIAGVMSGILSLFNINPVLQTNTSDRADIYTKGLKSSIDDGVQSIVDAENNLINSTVGSIIDPTNMVESFGEITQTIQSTADSADEASHMIRKFADDADDLRESADATTEAMNNMDVAIDKTIDDDKDKTLSASGMNITSPVNYEPKTEDKRNTDSDKKTDKDKDDYHYSREDIDEELSDSERNITEGGNSLLSFVSEFATKLGENILRTISGINDLIATGIEHLQNPWTLFIDFLIVGGVTVLAGAGAIILKALNAVVGWASVLPTAMLALGNFAAGFKYTAIASALKGLSVALLALAALIAVVGIVAATVDMQAFNTIMQAITKFVKISLSLLAMISLFVAIERVAWVIDDMARFITNKGPRINITTVLANFITSIAALLASAALIIVVAQNVDTASMLKAFLFITGTILLVTISISMLSTALEKGAFQTTWATEFKTKSRLFGASSVSNAGALMEIMIGLTVLVTTVAACAWMLQGVDGSSMLRTGLLIGSMILLTMAFLTVIVLATNSTSSMSSISGTIAANAMDFNRNLLGTAAYNETDMVALSRSSNASVIASISKIVIGLSIFMLAISAATVILSTVKPADMTRCAWYLLGAMTAVAVVTTVMVRVTKGFKTNPTSPKDSIATANLIRSLTGMVKSMAVAIIALAVALKIIETIDEDKLGTSCRTLLGCLTIVIGLAIVLGYALSNSTLSTTGGNMFAQFRNIEVLQALPFIISSISVMILAIAVSLGLISTIPVEDVWRSFGILAGMIVIIGVAIFALSVSMRKLYDGIYQMQMAANPSVITEATILLAVVIGGIIALAAAITAMTVILENYTIEDIGKALLPIGAALASIAILMVICNAMSKNASLMANVLPIIAIILTFTAMIAVFGVLVNALKGIPLNELAPAFYTIGIALAALLGIVGVFAALGPMLDVATPAILAIAVVIVALGAMAISMGLTAIFISEAAIKFVEALGMLFALPWGLLIDNAKYIGVFAAVAMASMLMITLLAPIILTAAITLGIALTVLVAPLFVFALSAKMLAEGIDLFSNIDVEKLTTVSDIINEFATQLKKGSAAIIAASVAAMGIAQLAILLAGASIGLLAFVGIMAITVAIMSVTNDSFATVMLSFLSILTDIGYYVAENSEVIAGVGLMMLGIGLLFSVAGATLLVAGVLLLLSATSLWGAANLFGLAVSALNSAFEDLDIGELALNILLLDLVALEFNLFSLQFLIASSMLVITAGLFMVGSTELSVAILLLSYVMTPERMSQLLVGFTVLIAISAIIGTTSMGLLAGSVIFAVASAAFLGASIVFLAAVSIFSAGLAILLLDVTLITAVTYLVVETFIQMVEDVCEVLGINSPSEVFQNIGAYIIEGFIIGVTENIQSAIDTVVDFANNVIDAVCEVLDINSPSEVFRSLGLYTLAGFCEGIENGQGIVESAMQAFGNNVEENAEVNLNSEGQSSGSSFINGLIERFKNSSVGQMFQNLGKSLGAEFSNGFSATANTAAQQQYAALSAEVARYKGLWEQSNREGAPNTAFYNKWKELVTQQEALREQILNGQSFIDPTQFMPTNISAGSNGLSGDTTSALAALGGSGGLGTSSLADSTGNNVGNTITTNNTYNFTQNNYSPEPIDRTELYTQTNNQLNSWYKWLRTQ